MLHVKVARHHRFISGRVSIVPIWAPTVGSIVTAACASAVVYAAGRYLA